MDMAEPKQDMKLVHFTAKQLASALLQAIALANGASADDMKRWRMDMSKVHFHDASQGEIAWNDVQAIELYNAIMGENLAVPAMASEGYNKHYHTSDYDGGWVGTPMHDHRDNSAGGGGFAFAVYHPGTAMPQQPWAV